jgi:hypothetical protein
VTAVLTVGGGHRAGLAALARRYGLELVAVPGTAPIPGSYWGAPEAGLTGSRIHARADTPVHSVLHELGHVVSMDPARRARLHTDAGGDDDEEAAVCRLQLVLADVLPGVGTARLASDMDAWGYSFREGSTGAWLRGDARDAERWLVAHGLLRPDGRPTWRRRGEAAAAPAPAPIGTGPQSFVGFSAPG